MAKKKSGLSFRSDDAIETGLFASGPAGIHEAVWAMFDYGGNAKPSPVLLVTYTREGEENYEQPYSIGRGWRIKDGELQAMNGQSGLPKSCNAMKYLIRPLEKALEASGAPDDFMDSFPENLAELTGVVVSREVQEKRDIKAGKGKDKGTKSGSDDKERTILVIEEITEAEWIEGSSKKSKTKVKAKGKVKDEDESDDDDADDDDDEKPKAKTKGKSKPADDDDDDADDDDDDTDDALKEEGIEALVSALEANDGTLTEDDLDDALKAVLKKNKNAKAIIALMTSADGLELEKGWTYNAKRGTIVSD